MKIKFTKQQKILYFYIFPGMIIIFIFALALIFSAPSSKKPKEDKIFISTSLPGVKSNLKEEKISAYRAEDIKQRTSNRRDESDFILADYSVITAETSNEITEEKESGIFEYNPNSSKKNKQTGKKGLYETRNQLENEKKTLEQFDANETYDQENVTKKKSSIKKIKKLPPADIKKDSQPMVNNGVIFNSSTLSNQSNKTHIKGILAYIHGDQIVYSGGYVKIRTGQETTLPTGHKIPANSFLYGKCSLQTDRLHIKITQVEIGSNFLSCNYTVYGTDGNPGLNIRKSVQKEENKKGVGRGVQKIGSVLSSGVKIASGGIIGDLAETATEGVIDAVADGTSKAATQRDIYLPNNDRIYLK